MLEAMIYRVGKSERFAHFFIDALPFSLCSHIFIYDAAYQMTFLSIV